MEPNKESMNLSQQNEATKSSDTSAGKQNEAKEVKEKKRKAESTCKPTSKPSGQSDQVSTKAHCSTCSCFHVAKEGDRFCAHCKAPACHGALLLKPGQRFPVFSPYKGEDAKERAMKRAELNAQRRTQLEQERKMLLKAMEIIAPMNDPQPPPPAAAVAAKREPDSDSSY